jgi:putative lipoic acid-binding regulatory protein
MMAKKEDFYGKLRSKLEETSTFPSKYMFKFIIPADDTKIALIEEMFNHIGAVITTKSSKSNKYKSLTILVMMNSVDEIINKYEEVDTVEGVISL